MQLLGSTTSPFVRRARVALLESGAPFEFVVAAADSEALKAVSPVWKVPVLVTERLPVLDSRSIMAYAATVYGTGRLAPARDPWRRANHLNAVDGAIESTVQRFYMKRQDPELDHSPLAARQRTRTEAIASWLSEEMAAGHFGHEPGVAELSWKCALDWFQFRNVVDLASLPDFSPIHPLFEGWDSVASTAPHD